MHIYNEEIYIFRKECWIDSLIMTLLTRAIDKKVTMKLQFVSQFKEKLGIYTFINSFKSIPIEHLLWVQCFSKFKVYSRK